MLTPIPPLCAPNNSSVLLYNDSAEGDSGWTRFAGALKNALFLLAGIFATTVFFVCLFYFKLMKVHRSTGGDRQVDTGVPRTHHVGGAGAAGT